MLPSLGSGDASTPSSVRMIDREVNSQTIRRAMIPAEWDESYSVGHPLLDQQHRQLLVLFGELVSCPEGDHASFHKILNDVSDACDAHFAAEEAVLRDYGYTDYERHRGEHERCRANMTEILFAATMGFLDRPSLRRFLSEWWQSHVMTSDMAYRPTVDRRER